MESLLESLLVDVGRGWSDLSFEFRFENRRLNVTFSVLPYSCHCGVIGWLTSLLAWG